MNGKTVIITGASSGIGKAAAMKIARAGGIPILVARNADKLEETKAEIERAGGTAYVYSCDIADPESVDAFFEQVFADHAAIDVLVNNAGRSIRRSIALSYDRFHDFERTIQLNYLGTIRMIIRLLPHMRERKSGHIVNVSSIGVQTNPPRFSAYVASKAALDAFTRVVSSETIGDDVTFTTIHMPLVKTPMIAPTKMYDSFPTITPEEAADLVCEAIRARPKQINTKLGTFGEVALRDRAEGGRPDPAHGLQGVPGLRRRARREGLGGEGVRRGDRARAPDARRPLVGRGRAGLVGPARPRPASSPPASPGCRPAA